MLGISSMPTKKALLLKRWGWGKTVPQTPPALGSVDRALHSKYRTEVSPWRGADSGFVLLTLVS